MKLTKSDLTASQLHALKVMQGRGVALALNAQDVETLIDMGLAKRMLGGPTITPAGQELLRKG